MCVCVCVCVCVCEEREREREMRERERERACDSGWGECKRESVKWCCVCIVLCAREECGDRDVVFRYKGM